MSREPLVVSVPERRLVLIVPSRLDRQPRDLEQRHQASRLMTLFHAGGQFPCSCEWPSSWVAARISLHCRTIALFVGSALKISTNEPVTVKVRRGLFLPCHLEWDYTLVNRGFVKSYSNSV